MPFTSEQDRFIVMAHFRSGTLNSDGNWSYSPQYCIEQFMQQYPDEMIEYDIFKQYKCRLVHRFETKNCICKGESNGRPNVLTENVIVNIQERINQNPKKAVSQLSQKTGLSVVREVCPDGVRSKRLQGGENCLAMISMFMEDSARRRHFPLQSDHSRLPEPWAVRLPDLTPYELWLWGIDRIYARKSRNLDDLKHRITHVIAGSRP
ncbi:hypothetical protein FQA39_LY01019 [Lamprigera yunnana]|nr:hypothetical protein FQA39_LY01019 [Lamprigera yunnana]